MKTVEERFIELIGDYKIVLKINSFPKRYIYNNMKDEWLIWHNPEKGWTIISYIRIWSFFEKEYNMTYEDVEILMAYLISKYFKITGTKLYVKIQ